ncbi:HAD family hydrolase [Niveispirillum sp. KHB5.9]|uniref:HAD family hydrolase n=1 Tax=Niveispirillum sp. KHB5.9 TaxID=3400269 RepID=UPI003A8B041F
MTIDILKPPFDRVPRAVLFDWDNTLITNWRCVHASINAALRAFSLPEWTLEESYGRVRKSLRDSFPEIFGEEWPMARDIFYAHFQENHLQFTDVLPGAEEMLRTLHGLGIRLGVVSNKTGRFLRAEADMLGWTPLFDALVGATDAVADKPDPAPVHLALKPMGFEPGPDIWFVGDADVDMEIAHRTGLTPILVGDTPHVGDGLGRFPPALCLEGCAAISSLAARIAATISTDIRTVG